ncbi:hypothetical protein [Microtetraspora niveoalba]|uniref:hypothetical protein n=1 Tax=Microtetraspora niveoalba TaxID=46175 RepID=UPI0008298495|nr:hypothetical protein [Microtetraspora niveoalba]
MRAPPADAAALPPSAPTAETSGWSVIDGPCELAFPLHTRVAAAYFDGLSSQRRTVAPLVRHREDAEHGPESA